jgi:hypothetical protein
MKIGVTTSTPPELSPDHGRRRITILLSAHEVNDLCHNLLLSAARLIGVYMNYAMHPLLSTFAESSGQA